MRSTLTAEARTIVGHGRPVTGERVDYDGLLGLVGLAVGWWAFAREVRRRLAVSGADPRLALAVCAGLVATLIQGIFDTIGIVQMAFVWIPYTALALAAAGSVLPPEERRGG